MPYSRNLTRIDVAVIDDDLAVAESVGALLEIEGFAVSRYTSAEAFIRSHPKPVFQCVLVDWRLPGMDGATLCRRLASHCPSPAMLLMSAACMSAAERFGLPEHVPFLHKPFDPEALLREVKRMCRGQGAILR